MGRARARALEFGGTLEVDDDRLRRALGGTVENRLDVVPIRVQQERGEVAGMIRAVAGRAVVGAACGQTRAVKLLDLLATIRLECEVNASGQLARSCGARGGGDTQLVEPKEPRAFATERNAQGFQRRSVEAFASLQIVDDELHVIDEAPTVDLVDFHVAHLEPPALVDQTDPRLLPGGSVRGIARLVPQAGGR